MKKLALGLMVCVVVGGFTQKMQAENQNCLNVMGGFGGGFGLRYERAVEPKKTWGGYINTVSSTSGSTSVSGLGLDISFTSYTDQTFVGPYSRLGVRYAQAEAKQEATFYSTAKKASASVLIPYALVGYNFAVANVIIGAGIGAGYGIGSVAGDDITSTSMTGLALLGDLNVGFQF